MLFYSARWIALSIVVLSAVVIDSTTAASAVQSEQSGVFSVRLETDKAVYRLGEPIQVRLTIRNNSGNEYSVRVLPPWMISNLLMSNAEGQAIPVSITPTHPGFRGRATAWDFTAGKSQASGYYALGDAQTFREWAPIAFWGYQLSRAGTYTLVAVPYLFQAWQITKGGPQYANSPTADRSNSAQIQVLK